MIIQDIMTYVIADNLKRNLTYLIDNKELIIDHECKAWARFFIDAHSSSLLGLGVSFLFTSFTGLFAMDNPLLLLVEFAFYNCNTSIITIASKILEMVYYANINNISLVIINPFFLYTCTLFIIAGIIFWITNKKDFEKSYKFIKSTHSIKILN